jgi:hypothetical protein
MPRTPYWMNRWRAGTTLPVIKPAIERSAGSIFRPILVRYLTKFGMAVIAYDPISCNALVNMPSGPMAFKIDFTSDGSAFSADSMSGTNRPPNSTMSGLISFAVCLSANVNPPIAVVASLSFFSCFSNCASCCFCALVSVFSPSLAFSRAFILD